MVEEKKLQRDKFYVFFLFMNKDRGIDLRLLHIYTTKTTSYF